MTALRASRARSPGSASAMTESVWNTDSVAGSPREALGYTEASLRSAGR